MVGLVFVRRDEGAGGMSKPDCAILVFGCPGNDVAKLLPTGQASECIVVHSMPSNVHRWEPSGESIVLVSVGPQGASDLCAHITAHGIEGVRAVVCVGATAPLAEREATCRRCGESVERAEVGRRCRAHFGTTLRLQLGPLDPLRAVADMARNITCEKWRYDTHELCTQPATHILDHAFMPKAQRVCTKHGEGEWNDSVLKPFVPIRLVIACAPDDGVCAACKGRGRQGSAWDTEGSYDCPTCDGTGKALSSADVARELGIDPMAGVSVGGSGGLSYLNHPTRAALAEHGLRAALELAVKE